MGARAGSLAILISLSALGRPAAAQDEPAAAPAKKAGGGGINLTASQKAVGEYSGVEPGGGAAPGHRPRRGKFPLVTWVGFQPQEGGGARVFIQLDRDATYHQEIAGGALLVTIDGARFANGNARRALDTRFFETALERIAPAAAGGHHRHGKGGAHGPGVELTIRFKNGSDAHEASGSNQTGKDGMSYILLDFAPGSGAPSGKPAAAHE